MYKWLNSAIARHDATKDGLGALPVLVTDKEWTKKTRPGVSTFSATPESVGPDHLAPLLKHALQYVPKSEVKNTPFFLLATAGVRMLLDGPRNDLLKEVCSYVRENTEFQIPDCGLHIQAIPGETEGLYGWIAANYLLGGFDDPKGHHHGKGHHTYGFLDMGGASAQIAFAPNATEAEKHANDLKLVRLRKVGGQSEEHRVFVTTWLRFGANEARRRFVEALEASTNADVMELPDPCLPVGLKVTEAGKAIEQGSDEDQGRKPHLVGTGNFAECLRQTYPLLEKEKSCPDKPCLINGQHTPAIDFDINHFVGVSEYWHTTHEIFEISKENKAYDFHTYQDRVSEFCSRPWKDIEKDIEQHKWGKKVGKQNAVEVCFKASWLINMLHDGIGIPRIGLENLKDGHNATSELIDSSKEKGFLDPFKAVNKINDVEVSWTLGKMVLYASSQIPGAPNDEQPVGHGSNSAGDFPPADFQRPGGGTAQLPDDLAKVGGSSSDSDWHDTLFNNSPRRLPGLILLLFIVTVALYLLCGRERRSNMMNKLLISLGLKQRRGRFGGRFTNILGRNTTPVYQRLGVLEAGGRTVGDFDLESYDSEDDEDLNGAQGATSSRAGKAPGWATPQLGAGPIDHGSPGKRGYMADTIGRSLVSGNVAAMDREGLLSRTESRDRLMQRSGSRASSPRGRSPNLSFKQSVD